MSDYSNFQPVNPMANFQQGYGLGQVIQQNVQAKAMAAAEAKRKEDYGVAFNKAMDTRDPEDYMNLVNLTPPDQRENFIKAWDSMEAKDQQNAVTKLVTRGSAYASGNIDIIKEDLQRDYDAAFNEGDKKGMASAKMQLDAIEKGKPEVAEMINNSMIAMIPGSDKYLANFKTMRDTQKTEQEMESDLYKLGTETTFASEDHRDKVMEFAKGRPTDVMESLVKMGSVMSQIEKGGMDENQLFNAYANLEDRYNKRTEIYNTVTYNAQAIRDSKFAKDGIADTAMISLLNKVLDPDSVTRKSEVDATLAANGISSSIRALVASLKDGDKLDDPARDRLIHAVNIIENQAKREIIKIQEDTTNFAKEFPQVNINRIFESSGTLEQNDLNRNKLILPHALLNAGIFDGMPEANKQVQLDFIKNATSTKEFEEAYANFPEILAAIRGESSAALAWSEDNQEEF